MIFYQFCCCNNVATLLLSGLYIVNYLFGKDLVQAIWSEWVGSSEEKLGLVHGLTIYIRDIASLRPGEELNVKVNLCFICN